MRRRNGYVGEGKKAFLKLKNEVLDQILLRRTKSNRSNDICLPPRIVRVRQHRLDEREEVRTSPSAAKHTLLSSLLLLLCHVLR